MPRGAWAGPGWSFDLVRSRELNYSRSPMDGRDLTAQPSTAASQCGRWQDAGVELGLTPRHADVWCLNCLTKQKQYSPGECLLRGMELGQERSAVSGCASPETAFRRVQWRSLEERKRKEASMCSSSCVPFPESTPASWGQTVSRVSLVMFACSLCGFLIVICPTSISWTLCSTFSSYFTWVNILNLFLTSVSYLG